jgi:peptidoglycan hydrolase FlgJ
MDAQQTVPSFLLARPGQPGMPSIANANNLSPGQLKARDVAEQFESVFLTQMLQHMFEGIKTDGPFGGGQSEEVYRSMLNQYYAEAVAKRGGIGIADAVYTEILKLQQLGDQDGGTAKVEEQTRSIVNSQMQGQAATQELK